MKNVFNNIDEDLLHLISKNLENCFDLIHARYVCHSWRSSFLFPSCLLRPSYSLPSLANFLLVKKDLCTLEKVPLFLFRVCSPADAAVSPNEYFLGGICQDMSEDHMELSSPFQCSVKVKIPRSDITSINMLDCQILPLGHQYRMIGWNPEAYRSVVVLPLDKERGGGEFIVLLNYTKFLLVLRSAEMRWIQLKKISRSSCKDVVTFRGRFYAAFHNENIFVIDPYSLEATPLMRSPRSSLNFLVQSGNDELFLVEVIFRRKSVLNFGWLTCRVSKLDEEAGKWVEVTEFGDCVLFIGLLGNVCCSAKSISNLTLFFPPNSIIE